MANDHHYCDSPFPSLISEHRAESGMPGIVAAKPAFFAALPEGQAPSAPTPYVLSDSTAMYIGHSTDCDRRLQDRGAADTTPSLDPAFPSTTTTIA
jgi:hypothetical protein